MLIKIIAKIYGHREGGQIVPKRPGDAPFEVDEKTALRLVAENVAELVAELPETPDDDPLAYGDETTLAELKEIAEAYGADASACRSKKAAIEVIEAARAAMGGEDEEPGDTETEQNDEDALPAAGAADPVA